MSLEKKQLLIVLHRIGLQTYNSEPGDWSKNKTVYAMKIYAKCVFSSNNKSAWSSLEANKE